MSVCDIDIQVSRDGFELNVRGALSERVTGLIGRSGSGKTTLLHALCGLLRPHSGRIVINDNVVFDSSRRINFRPEQRRIGMVFQNGRLFPHMNVSRNLRYSRRGPSASDSNGSTLQFDDVVELLELAPLLRRRPHELSGGEQRRVALGRALLSNPALLLLDEPLTGLDDRLRSQIVPLLRRVRDQCEVPMVYVCHDVTELLQMTSHAIVLEGGTVAGAGLMRDVARQAGSFQTVHDLGLMNVLTCASATEQHEPGITRLELHRAGATADDDTSPTIIRGPVISSGSGSPMHIAIRPQDVALSPAPIANISIQNQITGRVTNVFDHDGCVIVEIDIGAPLLVQITERARAALGIEPGATLCCLIKSSAIEYLP